MEKIKEIINKLLGKPSGSDSSDSSSGFTLVELLIVIAVIGILAAALLIAIDPIDKIRAGNDAKVQSDVRAIYDAANRAYAQTYSLPADETALEASGEMDNFPTPPSSHGTSYGYYTDTATGNVLVVGQQLSKKKISEANGGASGGASPAYFVASHEGGCLVASDPGTDPNANGICP